MCTSFLYAVASLLILTTSLTAHVGDKPELKQPEPALDNSDVRFEGGFLGMFPRISRRADQFAKKLSADDIYCPGSARSIDFAVTQ